MLLKFNKQNIIDKADAAKKGLYVVDNNIEELVCGCETKK